MTADHAPSRWERLCELFERAASLTGDKRQQFLESECGDDRALRDELVSLLDAPPDGDSGSFEWSPSDALLPREDQASRPDAVVGRYRLVRLLGRGGMGEVWLAERCDDQFRQQVAVKLVKRGMDTDEIIRRFRRERQLLANLEHPNIARLFDGGATADGLPYLVMEYVQGVPIDVWCNARKLSINDRLRLFAKVCDAVSAAHRNLIVHRDLKPPNILVTADGTPKLLDFGIARLLSAEGEARTMLTAAGTGRMLTPRYASPQQLRGDPVTTTSDVYSLGVVLYELLTGCSPHGSRTSSYEQIAHAVHESQPIRPSSAIRQRTQAPPCDGSATAVPAAAGIDLTPIERRRWSPELRGDLDNIFLMALRKEPQRRYQSVDSLLDDLRRHLDGRPITARPNTLWYVTGKFIRRHRPAFLAGGFGAATATLIATAAIVWSVLMPRWSAQALHQGRLELLGPNVQSSMYITVFWNETPDRELQYQASASDLDAALPFYDRAAWLARGDPAVLAERDAIHAARRIIHEGLARAPVAEIGALLSPGGRRALESADGDAGGAGLDAIDLREAGLVMLLVSRPREALGLLTRYEAVIDRDPFVEALLGELYLVLEHPALAYPRLRAAYEAFPESRTVRLALVEAALGVGDVRRARQMLQSIDTLPEEGEILRRERLEAMLLATDLTPDLAHTAFEPLRSGSNIVITYHYARALERAGRFDDASTWYGHGNTLPDEVPRWRPATPARMLAGFVRATEQWVASWDDAARSERLRGVIADSSTRPSNTAAGPVPLKWTLRERLALYVAARRVLLERPEPIRVLPGDDVAHQAQRRAWVEPTEASNLGDLLAVEDGRLWRRLRSGAKPDLAGALQDAWIAGDPVAAAALGSRIKALPD